VILHRPPSALLLMATLTGACSDPASPDEVLQPGDLVPLGGGWCDRLARDSDCSDGRCMRMHCWDKEFDWSYFDALQSPCPVEIQVDFDALTSLSRDLHRESPINWGSLRPRCTAEDYPLPRFLLYPIEAPVEYLDPLECDGGLPIPDPYQPRHICLVNLCVNP